MKKIFNNEEEKTSKDLHELIKNINSPYICIGKQIDLDPSVKKLLENNEDIKNFDMYKMIPKVTYDEWVVCLYEEDNKFYYIDEEFVTQVKPTAFLSTDKKYKTYFTEDGKAIYDLDGLATHLGLNYYCCGEGDDMNSYIVFNKVEE